MRRAKWAVGMYRAGCLCLHKDRVAPSYAHREQSNPWAGKALARGPSYLDRHCAVAGHRS